METVLPLVMYGLATTYGVPTTAVHVSEWLWNEPAGMLVVLDDEISART
jgi:hypothetical protein